MKYLGIKLINAEPMTRQAYNDLRGWTLPADESGADDGYLVEYLDGGKANVEGYAGYVSWSPADVFERAYKSVSGLSFGDALEALKRGFLVARNGWNGKGLTLELISIEKMQKAEASTLPYIVIRYPSDAKATPGATVPWSASQTDMLAEDWQIVPFKIIS